MKAQMVIFLWISVMFAFGQTADVYQKSSIPVHNRDTQIQHIVSISDSHDQLVEALSKSNCSYQIEGNNIIVDDATLNFIKTTNYPYRIIGLDIKYHFDSNNSYEHIIGNSEYLLRDPYVSGSNGTDVSIPDYNTSTSQPGYAWTGIAINSAPDGAIVTDVQYRTQILHTYPGDLKVYLWNSEHETCVWNRLGGGTDGGYDDDTESDDDIYLNWRYTSFFDGDDVNRLWTLDCYDYAGGDTGTINYFEIRIYYSTLGQTGDVAVTVKNYDGTSNPLPGSNGNVKLYDNNWNYIAQATTNSNGVASFFNRPYGTYYIEAYHNPNSATIFGTEFWGNKSVSHNSSNTTTILQRCLPYCYDIKVFNNSNNAEITGQSVPLGTSLKFKVYIKNPNTVSNNVKARIVVDRSQSASYDYDATSSAYMISGNNGTHIYEFTYTPSSSGLYYRQIAAQTDVNNGNYSYTDGWSWSESPIITIIDQVPPPSISPSGGTYPAPHQVTMTCSDASATIRYTTNNTAPTSSSTIYSAPFNLNAGTYTVRARAFRSGYMDSDEATSRSYTVQNRVPTPSITPSGGTYLAPHQVTITCSDASATIRYTTNNTEPTTSSTQYSNPFNLNEGTYTVRAKAFRSGYYESIEATPMNYTVNNPTGTITVTVRTTDGTSNPLPGSNGGVTLYDNNWNYIAHATTNSNGVASFFNRPYGTYYIEAYHNPNPATIFGTEFWGSKSVSHNSASTSTILQRYLPYCYDVKVFNNATNVEVTDQSVPLGTTLKFKVYIKNPNTVSNNVKARIVVDRSQSASYDYDTISSASLISGNNGTYIYEFTYTPTIIGTFYRSIAALTDVNNGNYVYTDGWFWSGNPIITVLQQVPDPYISPISGTYPAPHQVSISCSDASATIRYTTNNTAPTSSSTQYSGPFNLSAGTYTVRAKAFRTGYLDSNEAEARTYSVLSTGSITVEVRNIDGTSTPIPGANSNVKLYDNSWNYLDQVNTNANGIATFINRVYGSYFVKAYHIPNPSTIFGSEYWGSKSITHNSSNTLTILQRLMPYCYDIKAFDNATNTEITGQSVALGTSVKFKVYVRNPNTVANQVKARVVIDRNQQTAYDFDSTSQSVTINGNNSTNIFEFNYTPTALGSYSATIASLTNIEGTYLCTDGWIWLNEPIVIVNQIQPPTALPATSITQTSFQANWSAVQGATSYRLDVSLSSDFSSFIPNYNNATVTTTYQNVSGLTAGTGYYYRVRAVNSAGTSGNSNVIFAVTSDPTIPTVRLTVPYYDQCQAQWCFLTSVSMLLKYHGCYETAKPWMIAAALDFDENDGVGVINFASVMSTINSTFMPGQWYWENTLSFNPIKQALISTIPTNRPVMVYGLTSTNGGHVIVITGISQSGVYINDPSGAWFSQPSINHFATWTELQNKVDLVLGIGMMGFAYINSTPPVTISPISFQTIHNEPIAWNAFQTINDGYHCLNIWWSALLNDYGYYYTDISTDIVPYWYTNDSTYNKKFKFADLIQVPSIVSNTDINGNNYQAKMKSNVYRNNQLVYSKEGNWFTVVNGSDYYNDAWYINELSTTGNYFIEAHLLQQPGIYRIRQELINNSNQVVDKYDVWFSLESSAYSSLETILQSPSSVTIPVGSNGSSIIRITNRGSYSDFYKVYKDSDTPGNLVATTSSISPNGYLDQAVGLSTSTLPVGSTGIKEFIIVSNSDRYKRCRISVNYTIVDPPPVPPVAIPATNITQTGFQANWNASTGATSYQLDVSLNNSFSSFVTGYNNLTVNGTNQSVTGLTAGTTYYYRVRAVNANGISGNSNIITVLTIPPNPVATNATSITNTSFQANWNAATSATSYKLDVSLNNAFSSFVAGYNNLTVNGTSQSVTGLTQGTQYYYRVRAVNASGTSGSSNTILVTTPEPPPAPVAIAATNITQTGFQANWNALTGATSYQLDVSLNNSFSSFVTGYNNLTVNGTNQSVTGLTAGTNYYYRVRAVNANGTSGNSNIITVLTVPPNPVATGATNITQTSFQANWNASTGATSYQLDVSLNNSFSSFVTGYNNLTVNGTNQSVTGLIAGTTYYYRVRAVNANGTSSNSNIITVLTVPPNPVATDATNVTNTSFQANWNAATSASSYKLDVSLNNAFSSFVTGYNNLTVNGTNQSVTGLTQGTQYYYRVRAVNASGTSGSSNTILVTTPEPPPVPVAIAATNITQTGFQANWNASTGATSYQLDVSTNNEFSSFVTGYNNLTVNGTNQSVTGLIAGTTYYYRVRAINANGTSSNSNIITVLTVPPNPVATDATNVTNTSFQANWNASTSATSYRLDVSTSNSFSSFVTGYNNLTVNGTNQSVTGLTQGTQYYYRVRAVNASGSSDNSNVQPVTTTAPPDPPSTLSTTEITQTSFRASWNASTGATSYKLDVSINSSFSSFVPGYNNLTVNNTTQVVSGLNPGSMYYWRVRAVNTNGTSSNSGIESLMTIPPNPVALDATNVTNTTFQANWNAATSATSYKLDVSLNNSFSSFVTGYNNLTVNDTNQSVTNLTPGTQYYYRVRAVNASGESGNSNIIEVTMPVSSDDPNNVPVVTELIGCYPNPFNPSTTIKFSLDSPQHVMIQIFDISGRNVGNLVDDIRNKGTYTVSWNGTDNHGNSLASGVYLIQMKAGTYAVTRKVMMLK